MDEWRKAESVAGLGVLMADWLEGAIRTSPGYRDAETATETRHLVPVLAACNRAGFVTTNSQPGEPPTPGWDGRTYRQRAAVEGWVRDTDLLSLIRTRAKHAGLVVITNRPGDRSHPGVIVTEADGDPCTDFGWTPGHRRLIGCQWPGVGRAAVRELRTATHLSVVDPEWGRDDLLWPVLRRAVESGQPAP